MDTSNLTPPPGFVLETPSPPPGFVLEEPWGVEDTLRATGAVLGGFAALPVAGVGGYARLLTAGPEEATKTIEEIGSVPSKLLTTGRQRQAAEKVGGMITWPFVKAGKGYAGLAELISTGDLQKATDVIEGRLLGSNISVPIADVGGQIVGMVAMGGLKPSIKARLRSKPIAERPFRSIEETVKPVEETVKPVEEIKVAPPEGFVPEVVEKAIVEPLPKAEAVPPPAEIVQPGATSVGKQPWEMTRAEYQANVRDTAGIQAAFKVGDEIIPAGSIHDWNVLTKEQRVKAERTGLTSGYIDKEGNFFTDKTSPLSRGYHGDIIKQALSEGKPVPPEVLKDYPELAKGAMLPPVTKKPGTAYIPPETTPKAVGGIKEISSIDDLKSFTDENPGLFVRWSANPKLDIKQKFSIDKVSGRSHAGLSAVEIEPGWSPGKLARRVEEYGFLRMNDPNVKPWLYEGKRVGTDSDGYPVIEIKKAVGKLSDSLVSDLDNGFGKRLEIEEQIAENQKALVRTDDPIGKKIVKDSIDKLNKELSNLPDPSRPPEVGGTTLTFGIDITRVKDVATNLYNSVKSPPKWTTFTEALGKFGGQIQMGNLEMARYAKKLKNRVPDKISREAIVNYLQADGDMAILADRQVLTAANPKTKHLAEGYARARKLTPKQLKVAAEVNDYYDKRLQEAIDVDMLDAGVENYVNQLWARENPISAKLKGEILSGKLQPNPSLIRKRIFESYFEGEQAGYAPKNKDVGFLITAYDQAFNKAIASRAFIKSLNEKMASDGRPLTHPSGMGIPIPKEGISETVLIKPRLKPEEFGDYQPINHPALRKWKWAAGVEGQGINPITGEAMTTKTPIYLQGDLLVHPEIYKHLKNVLSTSALRQSPIGKAALTVVQSLKGTLLSLSGFHQTHVAQHALTHKVNPFNAPEIDLTKPLTRSLIEHGVSVADYASMDLFSEGMASSGLINKLPGIGPMMQKYTEYLFKSYIPRLKMEMATQAYGRNKARYGKELTDDQIQFLTGQQANAAFGELNYDMMGRNKTFQDVMRLVLLAPDFLEARARFTGQAVKPYGHEQFMAAAVRGALGMYTGARVINAIFNDGDPKWDKMFNVVIGGREYSIRSIQGDVQHLFNDPRSFVYHRMNPTTVRTAIEYLTSRDAFGRYRDIEDQSGDFIKAHIPIPIQGTIKSSDKKIWQSMLNSTGVTSYEAKTAFDRAVQEEKGKKFVATPLKSERDRMKLVAEYGRDYKEAIKDQKPLNEIAIRLKQDLKEGKIYEEDLEKIHSMATVHRTLHNLKSLSVEDVIPIWDKATAEEKQQYMEVFITKIENLSENHPERYQKLLPELKPLFNKKPEGIERQGGML